MTDTTTTPAPAAAPAEPTDAPQLPEDLGAYRIADLLAERTGHPVTAADVHELSELGHLPPSGTYKRWTLFSTAAALALDPDLVGRIAADRVAWLEASLTRDDAAARIGWHWRDLVRMGEEGRITMGRQGRYLITDLDRLAAEADGEQYITGQAAADVLEIRHPTDWRYVESAGWVEPVSSFEMPVGSGRRTVTVVLYRLADIRALREMPGVDWEAVRGLEKGAPSPLREYAHTAPSRAAVVRGFAQGLADRDQVEVWAWYSPYSGCWELDWERHNDRPTKTEVRAQLAEDADAAVFASEITLCPKWGEITREARGLLEPGAAVVLDTETTALDGQTIEIAAIDAATGKKLLDTLVKPSEPISQGAYWVHGITDADVADARPWEKVLPRVRAVTKGRTICAYNAPFDRGIIVGDCERTGKKPLHLADRESWYCLMDAYAAWIGSTRWVPLGGAHRAAGDCAAAREVLQRLARGRGATFTPRPPAPGDPVPGPPSGTVLANSADE